MWSQTRDQAQPHQAVAGREKYPYSRLRYSAAPGLRGRVIAPAWPCDRPTVGPTVDRTTSRALTRTKRKRRPHCWNRRLYCSAMTSDVAVWENLPHMSDELQEERSVSQGESEGRLAVGLPPILTRR